jgi:hypothetical protein
LKGIAYSISYSEQTAFYFIAFQKKIKTNHGKPSATSTSTSTSTPKSG